MYSIDNDYTYEYVIKKSKFIVVLIRIENNNISEILDSIKKNYPKATHYCYAYVLKNYSKYSDDGEPSGTAGIPILNSINSRNLVNVLCVVIRYFGGIKLGASGLIRTYGKVVRDSIDKCELNEVIDYIYFTILFDYDKVNLVNKLLDNCILSKSFDEKVTYNVKVPLGMFDNITNKLKSYNVEINITHT